MPDVPSPSDIPADDVIGGRYAIEREIGRGSMAVVFLARDLRHHRPVALKVMLPDLAASLGPRRFLREIEIEANLQHPHIVPVHDSGEYDGLLWYAMAYVEGESLRQRLLRERRLSLDEATRVAGEVADALDYAHDHGIVHRDIKPENILLSSRHAMVVDFGLARALSHVGEERLTATGFVVGTANYLSPEQASGEWNVDGRSDVYALGCVVYEMLVGEPPFVGPTPEAAVARRLTERMPSVRARRGDVPESVERALGKALARMPAERFPTAGEFARALAGLAVEPVVTAPPAWRSGRRALGYAAGAGALLLLAYAVARCPA